MPRQRTVFIGKLAPAPDNYQPPNSSKKLNVRRPKIAAPPALADLPKRKPKPKPNRHGAITPDVIPHGLD
ncbi:hypothetical protein ACQVP2_32520 [Methylobacterium aquaticum]|uniref:hypothetical protein n=1 Tax=Methylobacterium aquaticum TaxID=270351 RepID=UPI003D184C5B